MSNESASAVLIQVMGKEYQIACPEDQIVELKNAAAYLDQQMRSIRESGKVVGLERIAVMAALNITHDMQNKDDDSGMSHEAADEQVLKVSKKLDKALHHLKQFEI